MRTLPTRSAEQELGAARRSQQQPLAARGLPAGGGLAATLIALQGTHGNRVVQRLLAHTTDAAAQAPADVEEAIHRTRGAGAALQPGVRTDMESAFGADFSGVRVHTDTNADTLSRSLSAVAFTTGQDVYFRQGEYDPEGTSGRRLLAHELTHVVQQSGSTPQGDLVVGPPDDLYEQEAEHTAEAVLHALGNTARDGGHTHTDSIQRMCAECEEEQQK